VGEVAEVDARAVLDERRRGGLYRSIADLAERSGASRAALQRFAWAGACDALVRTDSAVPAGRSGSPPVIDPEDERRRPALWEAGGASRAARTEDGTQLALPLGGSPPPPLPALGPWERVVADYSTTGMTLGDHPMGLMRETLGSEVLGSRDLKRAGDGAPVRVAGMVVARQRPATAKGIVFMLLEDEWGTINLIVPPPVVERCRHAVRSSGFVLAAGKLEHREGTTNVVVSRIERLERPAKAAPRARDVAPPEQRETGPAPSRPRSNADKPWRGSEVISELDRPSRERIAAELAAALPSPHSFGRRGR
jgi:error-prone DNA polymerase